MKKALLLIFNTLVATTIYSQFRNYSNEFLTIGVDAQGLGMSKSVTSSTKDVNAIYWNPAGLVNIKDYQGSIMYTSYFANIATYNFASFAMPIDTKSSIAFSAIRFGVDDILNTTELVDSQGNINYDRISLFSATDYAFTLGYARTDIFKGFNIGFNTKIIRRIIGDFASSWGFGFDAGLQYAYKTWKFGVMARDVTTTFNTWIINKEEFQKIKNAIPDKNQELPENTEITKTKIEFGTSKEFQLHTNLKLLTEINLHTRFTQTNDLISSKTLSINPSIGFELNYNDLVYLRGGAGNFQKITEFNNSKSISVQPNFGLGINYKGIKLDYALTNIASTGNALYSNVFSIKFDYSYYRK